MKNLFATPLIKIYFLVVAAFFLSNSANAQQTCNAFVGGSCTQINAMYVKLDSTSRIAGVLGNTTAENAMLKFARDNGINYLIMYDLQGLVANSTRAAQLASLISRAKIQYGVQQVGAALAESQFADNIVAYNNSHAANERIDVLNVEREFWRSTTNRAGEFDTTINILNYFKSVALANNLTTEIYIGWITATEGVRLGDAVDRVLVHYYRQTDVEIINYGIERLQYLAGASRKVKVIPIFSNEGPSTTDDAETYFMGNWLATNPNDKAYKTWLAGYNAITANWKNNIEVIGSNWFLYNHFPAIYASKPNHITSNPVNQTACVGQTKAFTVASSATNKTYCWLKNGKCLVNGGNIAGANTASLVISNITAQDYANYAARVISYDTANPTSFTSTAATLTSASSCSGTTNLALGKSVTASSFIAAGYEPAKVVDGNTTTTRWASAYSGSQWIQVDLGSVAAISRVKLTWDPAYATDYQILTSNNGSTWTTLRSYTGNTSLVNDSTGLNTSARYVRINGTAKALPQWGFSLYEFEIY
ncbi:MAG: discoidin domain-containing protein [Cellvibrio sp.]|uniref:discoidin domain-containing protein n=1 Tax=Cellvibrio sp. TaxID=1965322 RepID=UPI0031A0CC72